MDKIDSMNLEELHRFLYEKIMYNVGGEDERLMFAALDRMYALAKKEDK